MISVVICAYTVDRWDQLTEAIESVLGQSHPAREVIVVVDHSDELLDRAREAFRGRARAVANDGPRGLSAARNTGVRHASGEVVAFLDDDASAEPGWLAAIAPWYEDPRTIGVGGHIEPRWEVEPPPWFPPELLWAVGGTHRGVATSVAQVRNVFGSNMSFRRDALEEAGGFRLDMGRIGAAGMNCEETELAIRASRLRPGSVVLHVPEARVAHSVRADNASWGYLVRRCWGEGLSKALVTRYAGPHSGLASERAYVARVLPRGFGAGLRDALRGDPSGLGRAAAIALALATTVAAYAYGVVAGGPRGERRARPAEL